jgi:hypothetical protein
LLDLDSLIRLEGDVMEMDVTLWRIKRLVATTINVENILSDYVPVFEVECLLSEDSVCLKQSVQDEPISIVS